MSLRQDQQNLKDILEAAHAVALEFLRGLPTRPTGRVPQLLPHDRLPEEGLGAMQALATFRGKYEAGLSASPGPRYLGFVTGGTTPAALAGAQRLASLHDMPAIVVASAGEVNTGEFDDIAALAELCRTYGAWLHVDGAFGLFAACDPAHAHLLRGLEAADSIVADGHKWLNVPYDSAFAFTRHLALQRQVFKANAAYLGEGSNHIHDLTPENSRRFRALPAWMTLMAYGRAGYRELVARCCSLAEQFGQGIEQSVQFELLSPVCLNIVCFALRGADTAQRDRLLEVLKADGTALLTPTHFAGKPAMRAAFANWSTSTEDVVRILETLQRCVQQVR